LNKEEKERKVVKTW